jgi:glycosyltransferase involved in cell wall biosynthesis
MTVHLVYPTGEAVSTPFAIGRELSRRLALRYDVQVHDHRATYPIVPKPGDVLVGHPTWDYDSVFNASLRQPGWSRRICIHPFAPGDARQVAHLDRLLPWCDLFLAITGPYWIKALPQTRCRHFAPKLVHLDLAVNREHFPPVKSSFNPPGKRKFLYIGNHPWYKNLPYLDAIAARCPDSEFAWIGSRKEKYRHLRQLGFHDFSDPLARELAAEYDFLITVGRADANPTTILEAMALGLVPVCTPQSGYQGVTGIINVPLDDLPAACAVIASLQGCDETTLRQWQAGNWRLLDRHFNWDRFSEQVIAAIESDAAPRLLPARFVDACCLAWNRLASPNSPWRPRKIKRRLRSYLKGR